MAESARDLPKWQPTANLVPFAFGMKVALANRVPKKRKDFF